GEPNEGVSAAQRITEISKNEDESEGVPLFEDGARPNATRAPMNPPNARLAPADQASSTSPSTGDSLRLYFQQMGRVALLTRECEIELAKRIELGEHALLRAILHCPQGLDEVAKLGRRIRRGEVTARDVVRNADEEDAAAAEDATRRLLRGITAILK